MTKGLTDAIQTDVRDWVPDSDSPPYGYDVSKSLDLWLWQVRLKTGLSWVKSAAAHEFAKHLYKVHSDIFTSALKPQEDHTTITKCLDQYYYQRHMVEEGVIRDRLRELLIPFSVDCAVDGDVVDCFSFITRVLLGAVFRFFVSQVRCCPLKANFAQRFKDREDMAKTYYLCGCVYNSIHKIIARRKCKDQLRWLESFVVDSAVAAKFGLPTRHVTMRTGGGLVFASPKYYKVFSKMEDYFYCTVSLVQFA